MRRHTREWVRKAEVDFQLASDLAKGKKQYRDPLCFHCQQSAEKYLKALLAELNQNIPRTHILRDLLATLRPFHPSLQQFSQGLRFLTRFAVGVRYPEMIATKRQAEAAMR
jgi:HEPN domain-containing protein